MKPAPIDYDTVREMLRTATPDRVLRFIGKSHPADIALLFKRAGSSEIRQLFDILFSSRRAAKTLKELPPELLPDILALIDDEKVGRLIVRADPDDAVTFIDSLPDERREHVMGLLDPERRAAGAGNYQLSRRHRRPTDDDGIHGAVPGHHSPRCYRQDSRAR
jgi:Mg/Co/Ni transporter MgtE